jgi:hypothetical protein
MKDDIVDAMAEVLHARNKKGGTTSANKVARRRLTTAWKTREGRWAVAPGKKIVSKLSNWAKDHYGVEFNPEQLARVLEPNEIAAEVPRVIDAIARSRPLR